MDLDEALAKIEAQFGRSSISKEEQTRRWIERGVLCKICEKAYCGCKCGCKRCWGQMPRE